ncbi:flagellar filament capping protein FliD [Cellulomonas sp. zg-ZUI199]|uniref:Flagellar hook-associated protein 2 n=1 Tax=Cellulomonas wangleii TaxID=2816956 RepID=A0ABX8DAD9_9CELL|nr:flagellar filament capping protein FliD [Cellulomonas wangleii]MBO0924850.1 flagellar filament capping protein FliD [Cellulomonas wangleii]QVI63017.1 flagellar filament capping protein FliD [Cellulomonas wangleii]
MATIDGIVSGLGTGALIDSLIALQAGQQTLLSQKKATASSMVTALQALNTKVASLAEHAATAAKPATWQAVTAAVTQPGTATAAPGTTPGAPGAGAAGATATVRTGAQIGTLSFRVTAVAQSQASLVELPATFASTTPSFTITRGGQDVTVTAASSSVPDLVDAFNAPGTGVRATAVKVAVLDGEGRATGETTYRLQLTGTETGAAHAFTVAHDGADLTLGSVRTASDSAITLFPGSPSEQTLTSASTTFEGVMTGVDLVVTAVTAPGAEPLTLDVTRDQAAARTLAAGLVTNLTTVLSEIGSRTRATTGTAADGGTLVTGGIFAGNTAVRLLQQNILAQGSMPVGGTSPSDVGIVLGKDGTFTFDQAVFDAAMAADPEKVATVLQGVAARLAETAKAASDPISGTLTLSVTAQQGTVRDLGDRIAEWDDRLAARRASLERTYASLETTLSGLQSQAGYLSSYLASSTPSTSS